MMVIFLDLFDQDKDSMSTVLNMTLMESMNIVMIFI